MLDWLLCFVANLNIVGFTRYLCLFFYPKSVLLLIFTLFLHVCKKKDFSFKDVNVENGIAAFRGWQLQ